MKKTDFLILTLVANILFLSNVAYSETVDNAKIEESIKSINKKSAELENEIKQLRKQVSQLRKKAKFYETKGIASVQTDQESTSTYQADESLFVLPVIVAPYFGIDVEAIVVTPSYNQDLKMLQQRQILENKFKQIGKGLPRTPLLELSGRLEAQANAQSGSNDINLTGAELDFSSQFNPWVIGFAALTYDSSFTSPYRVGNSRIYLDRGFITIGNLNKSPFYITLGQRYVPFGQYFSFMVSGPLTQTIGRTNARSILIGYQHPGDQGIYSSLYAFKGDTKVVNSNTTVNQYGGTLGYEYQDVNHAYDFGVDLIRNIADAQGMQHTGGLQFAGFSTNSRSELLAKQVPGLDVHGKFTWKPITFIGEYTGALTRFSADNLSFNNHGARPRAVNFEVGYNFTWGNKPSSLAAGYGRTFDALGLYLPQQRYITAFNISPFKNTITSIELQHAINYSGNNSASGQGIAIINHYKRSTNMLTGRLGVYF